MDYPKQMFKCWDRFFQRLLTAEMNLATMQLSSSTPALQFFDEFQVGTSVGIDICIIAKQNKLFYSTSAKINPLDCPLLLEASKKAYGLVVDLQLNHKPLDKSFLLFKTEPLLTRYGIPSDAPQPVTWIEVYLENADSSSPLTLKICKGTIIKKYNLTVNNKEPIQITVNDFMRFAAHVNNLYECFIQQNYPAQINRMIEDYQKKLAECAQYKMRKDTLRAHAEAETSPFELERESEQSLIAALMTTDDNNIPDEPKFKTYS